MAGYGSGLVISLKKEKKKWGQGLHDEVIWPQLRLGVIISGKDIDYGSFKYLKNWLSSFGNSS